MNVDISDFMLEISVQILITLNTSDPVSDDYGVTTGGTTVIQTNGYVSSKNSVSSFKTKGGSFIPADSFEFYIDRKIVEQYYSDFKHGGYFTYENKKYYIGAMLLHHKSISHSVVEGMYIGVGNNA